MVNSRRVLGAAIVALSFGLVSCRTEFIGDAQFPGGALGCFKQCQKVGMDMASFVYVGEYSSACACKPKVVNASASAQDDLESDEAATVAAAAGVELQRRLLNDSSSSGAASSASWQRTP